MRTSTRAAALLMTIALGCLPKLDVGGAARVQCERDDECPSGTICIEGAGRCVGAIGQCVNEAGEAVANGTECGDAQVCVDGSCVDPFCGDGLVRDDEQCDPRAAPVCRADCTVPFCGDGIVDGGEGCDSERADCRACAQICDERLADCDGDVDNGCECVGEEVIVDDQFYGRAGIGNGFLFVERLVDDGLVDLVRVPLDGGDEEVVIGGVIGAFFFKDARDNELYVSLFPDGATPSDVLRVAGNGDLVSLPLDVPFAVTGVALKDNEIVLATLLSGLEVFDRDSGERVASRGEGKCLTTICELSVCGDDIVAYDTETGELLAVPDEGEARELVRKERLHHGCTGDGRIVFVDGPAIFVDDRDGEPTILVRLPLGSDGGEIALGYPILFDRGRPLVTLTFAVELFASFVDTTGGVAAVASGAIIAHSRDDEATLTVALYDPSEGARIHIVDIESGGAP